MVRRTKARAANSRRRIRNPPDRRKVASGGRRFRDLIDRLHYNSVIDIRVGIYVRGEWSPCWQWIGNVDRAGYGRLAIYDKLKHEARNHQAHRVSYFEHKGLPYKRRRPLLMHQCDLSICIHPDHVDPGTHKMNMKEMVERGRHGNKWGNVANDYGRQPGED